MDTRDTTLTALDLAERASAADVPLQLDEDAFRGFYERTSRPVWLYLMRLSGDASAADDLLQETYYRFLRADVPLDGEAHRRNYLFRIATNVATDRFRRGRARPVEAEAATDPVDDRPSPSSLDDRIDVGRAMMRLGPRERSMLWLAYAQGASHKEIAGAVGVRESSVKTLLFRARRRFARLIGHAGKEA